MFVNKNFCNLNNNNKWNTTTYARNICQLKIKLKLIKNKKVI